MLLPLEMTRYVCIHGHFYQPPRDNPWLESIERQESAAPFHDWNERITAECYRPNAFARVLDSSGKIDRLVNNYARISFNVGPTLMSWLAEANPPVYEAILAADALAIERTGCGAAIAQAHGHLILPLCNARDRRTQVRWGARDFELRFGRRPKGMWLPETACDTASLEALAEEGIEFTVLAPGQAARVRPLSSAGGGAPWADVRGGRVETRRAYRVNLPSGRSIVVFFYDGPTSRAVAFERLLDDGTTFARRLTSLFHPAAREPQIVHIATDGETYGHHHRFGEMALAYAIESIEREQGVQVASYETFLRAHPPTWEAEIVEGTSWSCAHGIERWRNHCGCSSGAHGNWSQGWRAPLRRALDALRDGVVERFDAEGRRIFVDPWAARDAYIDVTLANDPASAARARASFLEHYVRPEIVAAEPPTPEREAPWATRALELMELQRHAMSMFTSCGWFFDDISGIETTQVLAYALRVLELSSRLFGTSLEEPFLATLAEATSNLPEQGDGRQIWTEHVKPRAATLDRAAAHFAVASLFNEYRDDEALLGFEVHFEHREVRSAGRARLGLGVASVTVRATREQERFEYAVIHIGDHHLGVGVRKADGVATRAAMRTHLLNAFVHGDLAEMLRALERHFARSSYSLRTLFKDEQKRILDEVLETTLRSVEQAYATIYEQQAPLMRYLAGLGQPVPRAFHQAAEYTLATRIRNELALGDDMDLVSLDALVTEARESGVAVRSGLKGPPRASPFEDEELATAARAALLHMVQSVGAVGATRARVEVASELARFLVRAGLSIDHDPSQDEAVRVRERLRARGVPADWKGPFNDLLSTLEVAELR